MMTREDIAEKLKEIVKPYLGPEIRIDKLQESDHLITDLMINSAYLVDIVVDTEEAFDIIIPDDSIQNMEKVSDVIDIIQNGAA